ncbi:hypothetical protein ACL2XG_22230 [Sodalis sp. RH24]
MFNNRLGPPARRHTPCHRCPEDNAMLPTLQFISELLKLIHSLFS